MGCLLFRSRLGWALILGLSILGPWSLAPAHGINISALGSYSETIDDMDLVSGGGSDLATQYESASDQVIIDITNAVSAADSWRVDIRKSDVTWDSDVRIFVRRTSDGTGSGSISGGSTFFEVTDVDQTFFSGAGDRADVDIQLRVTGLSVSDVPPDSYQSDLIYSLVDL